MFISAHSDPCIYKHLHSLLFLVFLFNFTVCGVDSGLSRFRDMEFRRNFTEIFLEFHGNSVSKEFRILAKFRHAEFRIPRNPVNTAVPTEYRIPS